MFFAKTLADCGTLRARSELQAPSVVPLTKDEYYSTVILSKQSPVPELVPKSSTSSIPQVTLTVDNVVSASDYTARMLMVIFGAGASYDSSPDFRPPQAGQNWSAPPLTDERECWRPILANRLFLDPHGAFGEIVKRHERLRPILPRFHQPQGGRTPANSTFGLVPAVQMEGWRQRRLS